VVLDPDPDPKLAFYHNKIIKNKKLIIMIYKNHIFRYKATDTMWEPDPDLKP
jgi:hypothetical protein